MLFFIKKLFVFEKGLLPKNPEFAENGLGCGLSIIKCLEFVMNTFLFLAKLPHSMNTTGSCF